MSTPEKANTLYNIFGLQFDEHSSLLIQSLKNSKLSDIVEFYITFIYV